MKTNPQILLAIGLVTLTVGYGAFTARTLMTGPVLVVTHPQPGDTLTDTLLSIEGHAENVTRVRINGRPIVLDSSGAFSEKLLTPDGFSTLVVEAENRFGQHTRHVVEFVGRPDERISI
jgi:Glucodextranase, domain B